MKCSERGMKVTLNVHPADGVRGHEDMYEEMAKELGVAYEQEEPIVCDLADPMFIEAYFQYLHHPREEEGVDFQGIRLQHGIPYNFNHILQQQLRILDMVGGAMILVDI